MFMPHVRICWKTKNVCSANSMNTVCKFTALISWRLINLLFPFVASHDKSCLVLYLNKHANIHKL